MKTKWTVSLAELQLTDLGSEVQNPADDISGIISNWAKIMLLQMGSKSNHHL
jgi:hypothetical protein